MFSQQENQMTTVGKLFFWAQKIRKIPKKIRKIFMFFDA
jgi:hypothetical protein